MGPGRAFATSDEGGGAYPKPLARRPISAPGDLLDSAPDTRHGLGFAEVAKATSDKDLVSPDQWARWAIGGHKVRFPVGVPEQRH